MRRATFHQDGRVSRSAACCATTNALVLDAAMAFVLALTARAMPLHNPGQNSQTSTRTEKIVNPLNGLLDEARRDIEKNDFSSAIEPLQKVIAAEPDAAY